MPSKTARQARAMRAAAAGKSTLGIPQSVGMEFVEADRAQRKKKVSKKTVKRMPKKKIPARKKRKPTKRR